MLRPKSISKLSIIATPIMIICGLLLSGATARAEDDESNLKGRLRIRR